MKKLFNYLFCSLIAVVFAGNVLADTIKFWTVEDKPPRLAKQQAMAD